MTPLTGRDDGHRAPELPAASYTNYCSGMAYRVFHRRFESYHNVGDPKGVMSTRDRATEWDDRTESEQVAAELNDRDRRPEYGQLGQDDWVVVEEG
jgi:hypothetical protein